MSIEKCQKWIKFNQKSYFSQFMSPIVLLILLSNESQLLVNSQAVSDGAVDAVQAIPQLLQSGGDLTPLETVSLPGFDSVRGFVVRNQGWITPMVAAMPAKLATLMTLRALRQQAVQQEQQQQSNGMLGGPDNGQRVNGGGVGACGGDGADCVAFNGNGQRGRGRNRGINGNDGNRGGDGGFGGCSGNCGDNDDDKDDKNSVMLFVGDGNIQVKNHKEEDEDVDSDQKYYTYQEIDEGKQWGNFHKQKPSIFNSLTPFNHRGSQREINVIHKIRPPKRLRKTRSKSNSKSNDRKHNKN